MEPQWANSGRQDGLSWLRDCTGPVLGDWIGLWLRTDSKQLSTFSKKPGPYKQFMILHTGINFKQ